jgi:hypothetical protein
MPKKKQTRKVTNLEAPKKTRADKLVAAQELLASEERKAQEAFYKDYEILCKKHGYELVPNVQLMVVPKR